MAACLMLQDSLPYQGKGYLSLKEYDGIVLGHQFVEENALEVYSITKIGGFEGKEGLIEKWN